MIDDFASRRKDAWRPDQDQALIDLRNQRLPWKEVGHRVNRTVESCCARYRVLVPKGQRVRFATSVRWSEADEEKLERLLSEKKKGPEIARELGRARSSIYSKIEYARRGGRRAHFETIVKREVPPERLADRDRRMRADRTITALICGDPGPGQSALDRRTP